MYQLLDKYRRILPALAVAAACAFAVPHGAWAAYSYKILHSFCTRKNYDCLDGAYPNARLAAGRNGSLVGTTVQGGKYNGGSQFGYGWGTVFELVPHGRGYKQFVLHNFCRLRNCPDGAYPLSDVVLDVSGSAYGTAFQGGANSAGTIYMLKHVSNTWTFSVVRSFCSNGGQNCTDGGLPTSGLSYAGQDAGEAWDGSSSLFGVTTTGGTFGNGVVFELAPNGANWNYTVIHNFQSSSNPNEVMVDSSGNIWGTTQAGGKYGKGLMYKLASGTWAETVLHNFCNTQDCPDGNGPVGRLAMDFSGNLFGVTAAGGTGQTQCNYGKQKCGVVFKRGSGGSYSVLYSFCSQAGCSDGAYPQAGVIIDGSGNLFGTTVDGGSGNFGAYGTLYELSGGTETVLHSFCEANSCQDGANPFASVIPDGSGGFLGTAFYGGANGDWGAVFRVGQ